MTKRNGHIKNLLFYLIMVALFLPMLQSLIGLPKFKRLNGAIENTEKPVFTLSAWFSGDYVKMEEAYLRDYVGFKEPLIRLYNQWSYSLFNKTTAKNVVIGREYYLYEENYIKAALGLDFMGEPAIKNVVTQLKAISDTLKSKGTDLVVLLAPGKGSFYPDYFPKKYDDTPKATQTNFAVFRRELKNQNILLFDAHSWFDSMKISVNPEHKLFSKTGIHWSKYGEYIVADSLLKYLYQKTEKPFPRMVLDQIIDKDKLQDTDNDLWKGMNLFFNIPDFRMSYPFFHREDGEKNTTKVLTVADSYFWGMYSFGLSRDYFNNGEFWYYFFERYPYDENRPKVKYSNIKAEMAKFDIVIIVCTDANLPHFGFGLLDHFK